MKKILLGLAIAVTASAQAQTSTTTPDTSSAQSASTIAPPSSPTQSMSMSLKEEESSLRKKLSLSTYFNLAVDAAPINDSEKRHETDVGSENYVQLNYKLDEDSKIGLRHNFGWTVSGKSNGAYKLIDPSLVYSTKGPKLGNFEPMAMAFSYYIPVSEASRVAHRAGVLRADISADYNVTTKFVVSPFTSPRFYINTNANETAPDENHGSDGSDSKLRFIGGASATYNFSDALNMYYAPYVDVATTDFNRGKLDANGASSAAGMNGERWNHFIHEVGVGWNVTKKISVTPAVINYVSMNTGEGFGREESMEYDLYVAASF